MHRYCTSVTTTRKGWVPSMRVWKLEAFDGNRRVAMIEEDCGSNDIKFRRFCQLIAKKGYQLTDAQVKELCATLALYVSTEKVDSLPAFLPPSRSSCLALTALSLPTSAGRHVRRPLLAGCRLPP